MLNFRWINQDHSTGFPMSCSLCSHSEGLPSPLTSELNNPPGKTTHFNFPHRRNLWSSVVPHHGRHFASSWYSALREVCEQFGRWGHDYLDGSTWFWILHHHLNEHNDYWKLPQIPIPYTFLHHLHHDQSLPTMTTGPSKSPVVFFFLSSAHSWNFEKSNQSIQGEHLAMPSTDPRCSSGAYFLPGPRGVNPRRKTQKKQRLSLGRMFIPYHQCQESVYHQCISMPRIWAK